MLKAYLEQLIDFNYWGNGLILKYAEQLDESDFIEKGLHSHGGLRDILAHMLFAEWIWLDRMQQTAMPVEEMRKKFDAERYTDVESLYKDWFDLELRMRAFVAKMPEEIITQEFTYTRSDGSECADSYADIITQVTFHAMQHRAECAMILTEKGKSPGNMDYLVYLRP